MLRLPRTLFLTFSRFLCCLAILAAACFFVFPVLAQTEQPKLAQFQLNYGKVLSEYRDALRLFTIASQQFFQLQTLASLEQAVKSTQTVMVARSNVLENYLTTLQLSLADAKGVELGLKNTTLGMLQTTLLELKEHRTLVQAADDRIKIGQVAREFEPLSLKVTQQAQLASSVIMYGRLQAVYDKTVVVKQEISAQLEAKETNPLILAEKRRGLEEVERTLQEVKQQLDELQLQLLEEDAGSYGLSSANTELDKIYGGLSRSLSYFKELVE